MTVESATYISQLNSSYPADGDSIAEGDNHARLLKTVLQSQFTSLGTAAVTVTAAQINDVVNKAPLASPALTGTPTVPTATPGTGSTQAANTAFVQAAIAAVNAQTGVVPSYTGTSSFAVGDGQIVACTNAGASAADFTATPAVGAIRGVIFENGRVDNTIDLGSRSVQGWNGTVVAGVVTHDQLIPFVVRWFGDYWRPV